MCVSACPLRGAPIVGLSLLIRRRIRATVTDGVQRASIQGRGWWSSHLAGLDMVSYTVTSAAKDHTWLVLVLPVAEKDPRLCDAVHEGMPLGYREG